VVRNGGGSDLSFGESKFLRKRLKRRRGMNAAVDYEALDAFYTMEEGGGDDAVE
jgi:hypothetical protein